MAIFEHELDNQMQMHIPRFSKEVQKSTLPWLSPECLTAIEAKHMAEGTDSYEEAAAYANNVMREEKQAYITKLKIQMEHLPKCSKQWWSLNERLLNKQPSMSLFHQRKSMSISFVMSRMLCQHGLQSAVAQ